MSLTLAEIQDRYQAVVGEPIPLGYLAVYIEEAQLEIAKTYGDRESIWYPTAFAETSAHVADDAVVVPLEAGHGLADEAGKVCLGLGPTAEIITYQNVVANQLTGVERGQDGTEAQAWDANTEVTLPPDAGNVYAMPSDLLIRHEMRDKDEKPIFDYQVSEDMQLMFFKDGWYRLIYTPVPGSVNHNEPNSEPDAHPAFHGDIVQYCIAKHWEEVASVSNLDDDINKYNTMCTNLLRRFYSRIAETGKKLGRNSNQQYEIGFRLW